MDELEPLSSNHFEKHFVAGGPITSVAFFQSGECVLVAQGPNLVCYSLYEKDLIASHRPFPNGGTIHGIKNGGGEETSNRMFVFGGRQLAFFSTTTTGETNVVFKPLRVLCAGDAPKLVLTVADWVWDATIEGNDADNEFILVVAMANNVCHLFTMQQRDDVLEIKAVQRVVCFKRCITYSMSLYLSVSKELCIACGTVENEVLLWTVNSCLDSRESNCNRAKPVQYKNVDHVLKGHEGVVHSVTVASSGLHVASTSDDRTVRLWKLTDNETYSLQWTGWGHTARVWDCCITKDAVVSVGEDGTARIWNLQSGNQIGIFRGQTVKSFWTVASFDNSGCDSATIATGGNDGTVKLWRLSSHVISQQESERSLQGGEGVSRSSSTLTSTSLVVPEDDASLVVESRQEEYSDSTEVTDSSQRLKNKKKKKKRIGQVVFGMKFYRSGLGDSNAPPNKLLVATRAGSLFSYDLSALDWTHLQPWTPYLSSNHDVCRRLASVMEGSCLAVHDHEAIAAIGTTHGHVVLVHLQAMAESDSIDTVGVPKVLSSHHGKSVQGLNWLDLETLVVFDIKGVVMLWKRQSLTSNRREYKLHRVLHTGTVGVPTSLAKSGDLLFVGDSRGNIASFDMRGSGGGTNVDEPLLPVHTCARAHQKEHVTDMLFSVEQERLFSVGNDGCVNEYVCAADSAPNPARFHEAISLRTVSLSGIARLWRLPDNRLVVGGYYGNSFAIIDVTCGFEFVHFDTGGRQRRQDSFVSAIGKTIFYGIAVFGTSKVGSNAIVLRHSLPSRREVEESNKTWMARYDFGVGLHGEPIFDACWCLSPTKDCFMLSGSEDCSARLSLYQPNGMLTQSKLLQPHESGIRAVCCSVGSRASLLVTCGGKQSVQFYSLHHSSHSFSKCIPPVVFLGHGTFTLKNAAIDHRVNAVGAIQLSSEADAMDRHDQHLVVTGDSNGRINFFFVHTGDDEAQSSKPGKLLYAGERPILSLALVKIDGLRCLLLAGTTAGEVLAWVLPYCTCAWNDISSIPLTTTYKAHQMGTNCITAMIHQHSAGIDKKFIICSGGDDQAITVCEAELKRSCESSWESTIQILDRKTTPEASSSAIKGVCFADCGCILSIGYSQRLALWKLKGVQLSLLASIPVDIGDVNCLAFCQGAVDPSSCEKSRGFVAVGGAGLELISVK